METNTTHEVLHHGYAQFITDHKGWKGYLITFVFKSITGSRHRIARVMEMEIERVYATLLTRIIRKPTSEAARDFLPVWIACPDYPVPKRSKSPMRDIAINNGLHVHALAIFAPGGRLKTGLSEHFCDHQQLYVRRDFSLHRVHAEPITCRPDYVAEYAFKSVIRRRVQLDEIIILPRARSEVMPQPQRGTTCTV